MIGLVVEGGDQVQGTNFEFIKALPSLALTEKRLTRDFLFSFHSATSLIENDDALFFLFTSFLPPMNMKLHTL